MSAQTNGSLPDLPNGWRWVPVAELTALEPRALTDGPFGSNLKTEHYTETGPRVIRLQNIGDGEFIEAAAHISKERFELLRNHEARAGDTATPPIEVRDALLQEPAEKVDLVLANPPFGKKSSITVIGEDGRASAESETITRNDFWATTSNKQLNFVQHIRSMLKVNGAAAVVLPDNVLFEGGAGETIRRRLLQECDVHTLLRLPTGIFYAQGVKANVLFFENRPASTTPQTRELWVYDLRTNQRFTLKTRTLKRADLQPFVDAYCSGERHKRVESDSFKSWTYEQLVERPGFNLDIWASVVDQSFSDPALLPAPEVIAAQIVEDATAGIEAFAAVAAELQARNGTGRTARVGSDEQDAVDALLPDEPSV